MQTEWTNLLLQGFAGGITGYVTNNYALNMLFREYTPLKLGGVIKKTKNEFISAISELVERDLLSPSHLKDEFLKEEALEEWNILFATLWDEFFQAEFQQVPLKEIPGIQKALPNWIDSLVESSLEPVCNGQLSLPELTVADLLSEEAFAFLSKRLIMQSVAEMQQGSMIDDLIRNLLAPLEGKTLSDFLSHAELDQMDENIQSFLAKGLTHWKQEPQMLTTILQSFLNAKEVESLVDDWENTWGQKALNQLLTEKQSNEIYESMAQFFTQLSQPQVQSACAKSLKPLLAESKLLNRPLLSLFTEETNSAIQTWLTTIYQDGFDRLLVFLEERESLLKYRVKQAAQAELSEQPGMLANMMQGPMINAIDSLDLVQVLSNYRDQGQESLLHLLASKSCKDLGLSITDEAVDNITQAIVALASSQWQTIVERLLEQSPVDLFGSNWFQKLRNSSQKIETEQVLSQLSDWIEKREDQKRDWTFLLELTWSKDISKQVLHTLKTIDIQPLQNALLDQIDKLYDSLKNQTLSTDWLSSILSRNDVQEGIKSQINGIADKGMNQSIHHLLSRFNQTESRNAFGENLIELIEKHGEEFLNGQIAGLVKTNLEQRDEEEIVDLAHDFIGRELQPITKFGFLLGLIAGILLALFPLPRTIMIGPIDLFPIGIFAMVGVLTNWIALQMIFRPYKELRWLRRIPFFRHFSQGYLLKNQKAFAENLAKFVDESLLNRNMIQQLFSDQKKTLKQRWLKWIPNNLPGWSKLALKKKQPELAQGISQQVQKAFVENAGAWSHDLSASLAAAPLPLDDDRLQEWMKTKGGALIQQNIHDWIEKNQDQPIDHWITPQNLSRVLAQASSRLQWKLPESLVRSFATEFASSMVINQSLPQKDQSLENIFEGALAAWTRSNSDELLAHLISTTEKELIKREEEISQAVNNRIQEGLNFLQRGGFVLMGGPALVDRILHRVLAEELPAFLNQESESILKTLAPSLESLLTFKQDKSWQLKEEVQKTLSKDLKTGIDVFLSRGNLSLHAFPQNQKDANQWLESVHQAHPWIDHQVSTVLSTLFAPVLKKESMGDLINQLPKNSLVSIKNSIRSAPEYHTVIDGGWKTITETLARNSVLGDWIPVSLLVQQIEPLLSRIGSQPSMQTLIAGMAESALPAVSNRIMETESIVLWTAENSFDPLYQAAHGQLPALLSTLSFQEHIITEVDALSPREIHQIFLSFAGSYFFRLEVYGLFGAVFGLHPVLPGLALVSEGWNAMTHKQRRKQ